MGRSIVHSRSIQTPTVFTYRVGHKYYQDGSVKNITYPSGNIVKYVLGGDERVVSVTDSSNKYAALTYFPTGQLYGEWYGDTTQNNTLLTTTIFNNRLQPFFTQVRANGQDLTLGEWCYDFHSVSQVGLPPCVSASTSGNNGNVFQVANILDGSKTQNFVYDSLNRLSQAYTTGTTPPNCWGETYTIDAWGNLTNRGPIPGMTQCTYENLNLAPASSGNQLPGISYDAAGNVTNDGLGNSPGYDAESRVISDAGVSYYYDADGRRIKKSSGTLYWADDSGVVLSEASLSGNINEEYIYLNGQRIARLDQPSGVVHYYITDPLGSSRIVSDLMGNVQQQIDYYPYGGIAYSSGTDTNRYKFTGRERDTESSLDDFGFRYYSSTLGRFMRPDDPFAGQDQRDPQTWNLYSYVANNPVNGIDSDGHAVNVCVLDDNNKLKCFQLTDADYLSLKQAQEGQDAIELPGGEFPNGFITCGGEVCGSAQYFEQGVISDDTVNFAIGGLFKGLVDAGFEVFFGRQAVKEGGLAIGKLQDLREPGTLKPGERTLTLEDLGNPKANWAQNASKLREAMREGKPIRDVSSPNNNTGFLRAERNVLQNRNWTRVGEFWYPPKN